QPDPAKDQPCMAPKPSLQVCLRCGGLAFRGLAALRGGRSRKAPTPDALAIHSLVAMSQVAVADGRIDDAEVRQISAILTRLTGRGYSMEQVAELLARLNPSAADLAQVGQDLSAKDRQIILEAALNIAVADGEIHPSEYAVVSDLAQRMQIGADEFRHAMARISQHLGASQPA
ncbi:MAG: TerB family tellurite resistance protein, partial [Pseudomonadota bacterium]